MPNTSFLETKDLILKICKNKEEKEKEKKSFSSGHTNPLSLPSPN